MKYTLLLTQECNLRCTYCYIGKKPEKMTLETAERAIDFIFKHQLPNEEINIGFFGGEPMLEFELLKDITMLIEMHPSYDSSRVIFSVVTNGTIYSGEIATFLKEHRIGLVFSCDGSPEVQDTFRRFPDGKKTSAIVEANIRRALKDFGQLPVNSVYHPTTLNQLPETVSYLSNLGIRQIYLSPDFSADWKKEDIEAVPEIYSQIAQQYIDHYLEKDPHFISLIDSKLTVILRGGYKPQERCRMGKGEMAFTPAGNIYPCERLIGNGENGHCIGDLIEGLKIEKMLCHKASDSEINHECTECSVKEYCMNWCGCSNFHSTGYYNRVSEFLCASEKAALNVSLRTFERLEKELGLAFTEHLAGKPILNSMKV